MRFGIFDGLRRGAGTAVLCAMLTLPVAACGIGGQAHAPALPNAQAVVDLGLLEFRPAEVTVRVGDTVEWRNRSLITHTVTAAPAHADKPGDAALPAGAEPFDSGDIAAGDVYLHRFSVPGTYRYFCMHHEAEGMVATVVVRP